LASVRAGEGYVLAEAAEAVGLPAGVLNVVTADREVSELLVRDPRVDKVTFTGSTAAGRKIASICGMRIARVTLELGGKSAAVILDDADIETTARTLSQAECFLSGQVCSSLTRIVVPRSRHNDLLEALASTFRGGDLRPGAVRHPGRRRDGRGADRQRHHPALAARACTRACRTSLRPSSWSSRASRKATRTPPSKRDPAGWRWAGCRRPNATRIRHRASLPG
jgi:hypothetical protein